jgi:hypothetical protein
VSRVHLKPTVRVTDHALVRFLERAGGLDVEGLRVHLAASLTAAATVAARLGDCEVKIVVDGLTYVLHPDINGQAGDYAVKTVLAADARPGKRT